jgi:hypothetical protein
MTTIQWYTTLFGTLSFMAGGLSAHLWFRASKINIPPFTGDTWEGKGPFSDAIKAQSDKNSSAAFVAAVAALLQALSMGVTILGPYLGLK